MRSGGCRSVATAVYILRIACERYVSMFLRLCLLRLLMSFTDDTFTFVSWLVIVGKGDGNEIRNKTILRVNSFVFDLGLIKKIKINR